MRNIFLCLFVLIKSIIFGQGLIINEISNGSSGNQEYYELVVIGSQSNPFNNVDLGGWIIDDNNGSFEASLSTGVATGHIRIKPGYLSSVKPGAIILIYNSAELFYTPDPLDANGDCIYFIPINDICLDNNNSIPSTSNLNYSPATYGASQLWSRIGLANNGDAAQVRKPDGTFFHGFSYGDVLSPFPLFPSELGGTTSFNVLTGSGLGRNYFFNCGSFTSQSNYLRGSSPGNETPGLPNNDFNKYFLNAVRNGYYDYSNLNNSINCGVSTTLDPCFITLPIELISFNGNEYNNQSKINWEVFSTDNELSFEIERSYNGVDFESIGTVIGNPNMSWYEFIDINPRKENYYRLKIKTENETLISHLIYVNIKKMEDISFYPNPIKNGEVLRFGGDNKVDRIRLYDIFGRCILDELITNNIIETPKGLVGFYYMLISIGNVSLNYKVIIK